MSFVYSISSMPFYDNIQKMYKHIYIIDRYPSNDISLTSIIKQISPPSLSIFSNHNSHCLYAICNPYNNNNNNKELLEIGQESLLFSYLLQNKYSINTQITDILSKITNIPNNSQLLCVITTP
tara:strand:- start:251 stop:619 length:369 start_codon:yes stop_codon:yes gene_type:complete